jgi:hypothetical protein
MIARRYLPATMTATTAKPRFTMTLITEHNLAPQNPKEYLAVAIARRPSYGSVRF